jgi:AcrR family transcriptional regulator
LTQYCFLRNSDAETVMTILERPAIKPSASARTKTAAPVRRNPERTRARILQAAMAEFSQKGLDGARVDEIARRSRSNKRMIYHYFGNKEDLFLAVLERAYDDIRRAEAALHLDGLDPETAMRRLNEFSFDYSVKNPHFIHLLNGENLYRARHLRRSRRIMELNSPIIAMLRRILERGQREGVFRKDVDPLQLYISIAALGYFYLSNNHTLSAVFGRDLADPHEIHARRNHNVAVIIGFLKQGGG